jgi:[ribosomal protein S18]-alanine N-acetyltransferase
MSYLSLVSLHSECFPDKNWGEKDFAELKASGADIIFSDNSFIVWRSVLDEAEIITIGVKPLMRRSGIADTLLVLMERELKQKNVHKVFLEVSIDNLAAIKLYEKNGFVRAGLRPKYYNGIDAVTMVKEI